MSIVGAVEEVLHPDDFDSEDQATISLLREEEGGGGHTTIVMENEKRMRREIANSNERRRMQSINAGFQSLRSLLPHHEGEKLSKAAILQQTAQYIIALEREKTQLLTQNCQLKRLVDQHDNGAVVEVVQAVPQTNTTSTSSQPPHALKKRKLDTIYTIQTISDSSDEGLGSMSPEPTVTLLSNQNAVVTASAAGAIAKQSNGIVNAKDFVELKTVLEMERRKNLALEERLRQLTECHPIYTNGETISYQQHEVIEHTDNLRHDNEQHQQHVHTVLVDKVHHNMQNLHVLALDSIPAVGQTQVVMCSPIEHNDVEMVEAVSRIHHNAHIDDDDSRTLSPCDMMNSHIIKEEFVVGESRPQSPAVDNNHHMQTHSIVGHQMKSTPNTIRLQPILEAAIKAEPKVEVERIHSPSSITVLKDCNVDGNVMIPSTTQSNVNRSTSSRMYIAHQNTSRQNLETIVEAIRHLEGDQLFGEMIEPTQEAPLALTNKPQQRQLQIEMNPFLQFRSSAPTAASSPPSSALLSTVQTVTTACASSMLAATSQTSHQHSPLLQAQLQHPKCINLTTANASITTIPTATASPNQTSGAIIHSHHSINNRPGVIVVKQHS